jgi:ketosteroid isomerase-like protein
MEPTTALELAERVLGAWNTQDVAKVVACYVEDVRYRDPNTRGHVEGGEALGHYLTKLFAAWRMRWTAREIFPLAEPGGFAVLWHATFQRPSGGPTVETDGMDLVLMDGERIARNEVYFDRAILAPLLGL